MGKKTLAQVLESPKRFIEYLRSQPPDDIAGYSTNDRECPIANWLRTQFPEANSVSFDGYEICVEYERGMDTTWDCIPVGEMVGHWTVRVTNALDIAGEQAPISYGKILEAIEKLGLDTPSQKEA